MTKIDVFLYSYKNKGLLDVVSAILSNTKHDHTVYVYDQNNINRSSVFGNLKNVIYEFIPWDIQLGPGKTFKSFIEVSTADHVLYMSDDARLSPDWDKDLVEFLDKNSCILSGNRSVKLQKQDMFSLSKQYSKTDSFNKTQWIDRNFIFAKRNILNKINFPFQIKYYGFEELLSINSIDSGVDIFCVPGKTYSETNSNNIQRLYTPFSKEHNYNDAVDGFNDSLRFKQQHGLQDVVLLKLPYPNNDVEYDHYDKFDIDAASDDKKKYNTRVNRIGPYVD